MGSNASSNSSSTRFTGLFDSSVRVKELRGQDDPDEEPSGNRFATTCRFPDRFACEPVCPTSYRSSVVRGVIGSEKSEKIGAKKKEEVSSGVYWAGDWSSASGLPDDASRCMENGEYMTWAVAWRMVDLTVL